jgi:hypothetical protein
MFETIVVLTYAFIANIPLSKFSWLCYITLYNANSLKIPLNYVCFKLIGWFNHHNVFSTNQISLLQIFALWLQKIALWLQKIALWLQKIAMWLQKIALLFEINCTEINQSQSSNVFMYIITIIITWMFNLILLL